MSPYPNEGSPQPEALTTREARQGTTPHRVRYMLMVGIPVVIIGFIIAYFIAT